MRVRSYTFHVANEARPGEAQGLERAVLVPDGFVWPAFAFTVLWFLYHRLWIAAAIVLVGLLLLGGTGFVLGLPAFAVSLVGLLAACLIGLEASSLRRWTLARSGRPARDAVVAPSLAEAEARALNRWLEAGAAIAAARPPFPGGPTRRIDPVIGLFPAPEGAR